MAEICSKGTVKRLFFQVFLIAQDCPAIFTHLGLFLKLYGECGNRCSEWGKRHLGSSQNEDSLAQCQPQAVGGDELWKH